MPYQKSYKKSSSRRSYKSRFNDKRINTSIERKIKEIAVAEDQKNIQYFIKPKLCLDYTGDSWISTSVPSGGWAALNGIPVTDAMMQIGAEDQPYALNLTEIGGNLRNQNQAATSNTNRAYTSNAYLVKRVEAHMTLRNTTSIVKKCAILLVSFPNTPPGADGGGSGLFNRDNIYTLPFSTNMKYSGMFQSLKSDADIGGNVVSRVDKSFTVHAKKVVSLPPTSASNGGRVGNTNAVTSTAYHDKDVHISKEWKVGKKFVYQQTDDFRQNQPCSNDNLFLVMCCNGAEEDTGAVVGYGIAGCRYRILQATGRGKNAATNILPTNA